MDKIVIKPEWGFKDGRIEKISPFLEASTLKYSYGNGNVEDLTGIIKTITPLKAPKNWMKFYEGKFNDQGN